MVISSKFILNNRLCTILCTLTTVKPKKSTFLRVSVLGLTVYIY